jgi:hypothetical protein
MGGKCKFLERTGRNEREGTRGSNDIRRCHLKTFQVGPSVVAQAYNSNFSKGKDWKDHNSRPAQQNVRKTPSQPMAGCRGTCLSSQLCREAQIEGSWSRPAQA